MTIIQADECSSESDGDEDNEESSEWYLSQENCSEDPEEEDCDTNEINVEP